MTKKKDILRDIQETFAYDPKTGIFKYKKDISRNTKAGKICTGHDKDGYPVLSFNGKRLLAHRAAFVIMKNRFPKEFVDHINHKRDDNRWINLRECSRKENEQNQKQFKNNTSGFTGISFDKQKQKWHSYININKKRNNIGYFDELKDAIKARQEANIKYGFHKNHGRKK